MGRATMTAGMLAFIGLAVLLAASTPAQDSDAPNLSGTWTLNVAKSKARKGTTLRSQTVDVSCSATHVVITETFDDKERTLVYLTDGRAAPIAQVRGGKIIAKAYWKKSTLVIETFGVRTSPDSRPPGSRAQEPLAPDPETEMHTIQRWTLSADGKVLTRDFDDAKQVFVYDLQ
jgi:hypothetical protein